MTRPSLMHGLLLAFAMLVLPASVVAQEPYDHWYILEMAGQRAGWMNSSMVVEGEHIISRTDMRLVIKRGRSEIEIRMKSAFTETKDGKPITLSTTQQLGAAPETTVYTYEADKVIITSMRADGEIGARSEAPLPDGVWLTPWAAEVYSRKRLEAGAETIEVRTVDPTAGIKPVVTTRRIVGREPVEALGKTVSGIKWVVTVDLYPDLETIDYSDRFGTSVRSEVDLGGIKMTTLLADRDLAKAELDPPEILVSTLVTPDKRIRKPRDTKFARFELRVDDGKMPDIPTTGTQTQISNDGDRLIVEVDVTAPNVADAADLDHVGFTEASPMVDAGDQTIRQLARRAVRGADGAPRRRAEAMRRFVHEYVDNKTLDVGFASASEVARTRAGDCSEHGVLLTAMLRADGIPARTVSGLIYADHFAGQDGIFGYHMWTQALLEINGEHRWIDLDATLPDAHPYDATHIALAVTDLADGVASNAMVQLTPLLGRLQVNVLETSHERRKPVEAR